MSMQSLTLKASGTSFVVLFDCVLLAQQAQSPPNDPKAQHDAA
jgi:hypothetical protein